MYFKKNTRDSVTLISFLLCIVVLLCGVHGDAKFHTSNENVRAVLEQLGKKEDADVQPYLEQLEMTNASEEDYASALLQIGSLYLYGNGSLYGNKKQAMDLCNESAAMGNSRAQHLMAVAYSVGIWGVERDEGLSILNYYFASLGGEIGATMALGYRHMHGIGVPEQCETALVYYEMAANAAVEAREAELVPPMTYDQSPQRISDYLKNTKGSGPDNQHVVDYYHFSADNGHVDTLITLGALYYYGAKGVKQDLHRAAEMFSRAIEKGGSSAHANIGHMYTHGLGVEKDMAKALEHFETAAREGNRAGQNGLGYMYMYGLGVGKDHREAIKWLNAAATQGDSEAMYNLGVMYMGATGENPDFRSALRYFRIAAEHSHTLALHKLAQMHAHGLGISRSCQIASSFFKTVAEKGPWVTEMHNAAVDFAEGREYAAFVKYLIKAEEGYEVSQHNAATMIDLQLGTGGTDIPGKLTLRLYQNAAAQGNIDANLKIGDLYYYGRGGLPVNYERAVTHYRQASKRNNAQAMFNLGMMHEHGVGLPQDFFLAKRWYDLSSQSHKDAFVPAMLALGKLCVHAEVARRLEQVQIWWSKRIGGDGQTAAPNETASASASRLVEEITGHDSIAIMVLSLVLCTLLYWRSERRR